jgi:hypothetical protein
VNAVIGQLKRFGLAGRAHLHLHGPRPHRPTRLFNVTVNEDDERWLVAPYREVGWVRNARAAGGVEIRRDGRPEALCIEELGPEQSALVVQR